MLSMLTVASQITYGRIHQGLGIYMVLAGNARVWHTGHNGLDHWFN